MFVSFWCNYGIGRLGGGRHDGRDWMALLTFLPALRLKTLPTSQISPYLEKKTFDFDFVETQAVILKGVCHVERQGTC